MGSSRVVLIGLCAITWFAACDAKAQALTAPQVVDQLQDMPAPKPKNATAGRAAPSGTSTAENVPTANPLWTIPLTNLTITRERPLFSPSRRPPPPVMVAKASPPPPPPPKPAEPEKPQILLVGTILGGEGERIGLFVSPGKNPLRLKLGEDDKGWVLRAVQPRQVVLEKGKQSAVLELPRRDVGTGGFTNPSPSNVPAVATNVVEPLASPPPQLPASPPSQPLVNPFAVGQIQMVPLSPDSPFAGGQVQKARLR